MTAQLHIICGLPCSGKSTLAKSLEVELPGLRLGPDEWLVELVPDRNQDEVGRQRPILNEIQWGLAQRALVLGCNVILEHGFWGVEERQRVISACAETNVQVHMHYMKVKMSVLQSRLVYRNQNLPDDCFFIAPELLEQWAPDFQAPEQDELVQYSNYVIYEPEV